MVQKLPKKITDRLNKCSKQELYAEMKHLETLICSLDDLLKREMSSKDTELISNRGWIDLRLVYEKYLDDLFGLYTFIREKNREDTFYNE